jgi:hypothetical protein
MKKRTLAIVFVGYVMVVLLVFIVVRSWSSSLPFDAATWRNEEISTTNGTRVRMADRLVDSHALLNKSRGDVVSMLGEPPPTEYFRDWDLVYYLGPERGFISIDSEWLVVRFDDDGRVTDCQIVRD